MEKKSYRVLFPIAFGGRREKGEVIEMTDEEARRISPERIECLAPEEVVEETVDDTNDAGTGSYSDDDEDEKGEVIEHTVTDADLAANPELKEEVKTGDTIEIPAEGEVKPEGETTTEAPAAGEEKKEEGAQEGEEEINKAEA